MVWSQLWDLLSVTLKISFKFNEVIFFVRVNFFVSTLCLLLLVSWNQIHFLLDQNVLINSFHSHNKSKLSVLVIWFILSRAVPEFFSRGGSNFCQGGSKITEIQSLSTFKQMLAVSICFNKCNHLGFCGRILLQVNMYVLIDISSHCSAPV